jgi:voltage-gated potassium channel
LSPVERSGPRRFLWAQLAYLVVLVVGTLGFHRLIEDEGWVDALYRSVVTTTLTGLAPPPSTRAAEIFSILLLLAGVVIFLFLAGVVVDVIARGALADALGGRRRKRAISTLEDHVVICGYGRVGRRVAEEFRATGTPFVVVDVNPGSVAAALAHGALVVQGDGTDDERLVEARLDAARGLVASADSDEKNLYIVLSARASRPDLFIVARASDESAARKLRLAGADRVVQPYSSAGVHIANMVLKPQVADFLDIVSTAGGPLPDLRVEEILVTAGAGPCGRTLRDLRIEEITGSVVVAVRRADGAFDITPGGDLTLEAGDVVIGVGTTEEIRRLEDLFTPAAAVPG